MKKNPDGSFSLKNGKTNNYLTSKMKGEYELKLRNENDVLQKFLYRDRSLKSFAHNNCLEIKKKKLTPNATQCPHSIDVKIRINKT